MLSNHSQYFLLKLYDLPLETPPRFAQGEAAGEGPAARGAGRAGVAVRGTVMTPAYLPVRPRPQCPQSS